MAQMARAHNIPVEHDDYFKFLVQKKMTEFEKTAKDGDEVPEDFFSKIADEVSQFGGQGSEKRKSLGAGNGGGKKPAHQNNGDMTAEKLAAMSLSDMVAFKQKDPRCFDVPLQMPQLRMRQVAMWFPPYRISEQKSDSSSWAKSGSFIVSSEPSFTTCTARERSEGC